MALNGKYELVNLQEFIEYLKKGGIPAESLKVMAQTPFKLEVKVESSQATLNLDSVIKKSIVYVFGQATEEEVNKKTVKSTASLSGNILTIVTDDDSKRVYAPTANGLEETITSPTGQIKLNYKKI